jgi:predicted acyltransferase
MWNDHQLVFKSWEWTTNDGLLHGVRILGVLQRIALAYFFASLIIYFFKTKGAFVFSAITLLAYWFLCLTLGDKTDPYSLSGYVGTHLDKAVLSDAHMYRGEGVAFDPEGIASTLTPIAHVIFGYLAGQYIQQKGKTYEMLSNLFVAGTVLVFAGFAWDLVFPINKKIWTSSYVLYTTGLAIFTLSLLIFIIEFKNVRGAWSRFFDVFGKNPLFIFVLSGFLPRLLSLIRIQSTSETGELIYISPFGWFYEHTCKPISGDLRNGSLLYSLFIIAFYWLIAYMLDKRKIYIKV